MNQMGVALLGCVNSTSDPMYDKNEDEEKSSTITLSSSPWDTSFRAFAESVESGQEQLYQSLYDSFESLEVYVGSESFHESLDTYFD